MIDFSLLWPFSFLALMCSWIYHGTWNSRGSMEHHDYHCGWGNGYHEPERKKLAFLHSTGIFQEGKKTHFLLSHFLNTTPTGIHSSSTARKGHTKVEKKKKCLLCSFPPQTPVKTWTPQGSSFSLSWALNTSIPLRDFSSGKRMGTRVIRLSQEGRMQFPYRWLLLSPI